MTSATIEDVPALCSFAQSLHLWIITVASVWNTRETGDIYTPLYYPTNWFSFNMLWFQVQFEVQIVNKLFVFFRNRKYFSVLCTFSKIDQNIFDFMSGTWKCLLTLTGRTLKLPLFQLLTTHPPTLVDTE